MLKSLTTFILALFICQTVFAGSVSRYCPTSVLLCESDEVCRAKRVFINTKAIVFFKTNGLVESLNITASSKELDEAYGEFKNPMIKQKLGFAILENQKYYLAVPLQSSKGLYIKEKRSSEILAPGEKENGAEWELVCN